MTLALILSFLILTCGLGGLAAIMAGRALALAWRSPWQIVAMMFLLALAVRFLHYALVQEELLSGAAFAADFIMLYLFAWTSFTMTRRRQMQRQYGWLTSTRP